MQREPLTQDRPTNYPVRDEQPKTAYKRVPKRGNCRKTLEVFKDSTNYVGRCIRWMLADDACRSRLVGNIRVILNL